MQGGTAGVARGGLRGSGAIAVAMGVMNLSTYGFTVVAARFLGPGPYGAFAGLMATLLVLGVLQLGLQATAARRISAAPDHVAQIERGIQLVTCRAALLLGALSLLLSPALVLVLHLDSLAPAVLVALTVVPMTVMGGQAGILQGERRWGALAMVYLANGVPRLVLGTASIAARPTETGAMTGVALAAWAPVLVGWFLLRAERPRTGDGEDHVVRRIAGESVRSSRTLLAFMAVSNIDVVVARGVLEEHDAGLYAGGLIVTKAVLFLPQFVVVVAFPSMATAGESDAALRSGITGVGVLGLLATGGAWLLPELALAFVGGGQYEEIAGSLWLFAVLGTLLAMLQLMVYAALARQGRWSGHLVWAALAALVLVGAAASSLRGLLLSVIAVEALLLVALLLISAPPRASCDPSRPRRRAGR